MTFNFLSKSKTLKTEKLFYLNSRNYRLLFIGPPGVGKGTFANIIGPQLNATIVDTGRILRKITSHHSISNTVQHNHHNHTHTHNHNKHISYCSGFAQHSLGHVTTKNMNHQSINHAHTDAHNHAHDNVGNSNDNSTDNHDHNHNHIRNHAHNHNHSENHNHNIVFDHISPETKKMIETYMAKGELIPDNVLLPIMLSHLQSINSSFILDGFPRTLSQIKWLYDHNFHFDLAIRFHLPDHILFAKMLGRRMCQDCGNTYNVANTNEMNDEKLGISLPLLNPKNENKCDKCNGNLVSRSEDTMHTLQYRMSIYYQQTEPIIQFLNENNKDDGNNMLLNFNIKRGIQDSSLLLSQIKETLGNIFQSR